MRVSCYGLMFRSHWLYDSRLIIMHSKFLSETLSVPSRKECGTWQGPHHLLFDRWTSQIWEVRAWQEEGRVKDKLYVTHLRDGKFYMTDMFLLLSEPQISVYPREVQPENPNSYRARKREYFRMQRERKKARKEGIVAEPQLVLASADDTAESNPNCWYCRAFPALSNQGFLSSCTMISNSLILWSFFPCWWTFISALIIRVGIIFLIVIMIHSFFAQIKQTHEFSNVVSFVRPRISSCNLNRERERESPSRLDQHTEPIS